MIENCSTQEQLDALAARREALGGNAMRKAEQDRAEVIGGMKVHADAGTDPRDPEVHALAKRWRALIEAFTGGDAGIERSLDRMYASEPKAREHAGIDEALMQYVQKAWAVLDEPSTPDLT